MRIFICIQCRLSSKRLPEKVLKIVDQKPLISYLIDSLKKTTLENFVYVLTSKSTTDEKLIDYCKKNNIKYFTGSLHNVYQRFEDFSKENNADAVIRLSGDSPLIDFKLINKFINLAKSSKKHDLITNIFPRTFPSGQSVEVIFKTAFKKVIKKDMSLQNKEHVTSYFYENSKKFSILNILCPYKHKFPKLSIDTPKDFDKFGRFVKSSKNKDWEISQIIKTWQEFVEAN